MRHRIAEADPGGGLVFEIAAGLDPGARRKAAPAHGGDLAADEGFERLAGGADRHIGIAPGKIEHLIADIHVETNIGIGGAEARQDRRQQMDEQCVIGGDAQFPGRLHVAPGDGALEVGDVDVHALGEPDHLLAGGGRRIAGAGALEQLDGKLFLQRAEPAEHGGMIEAQRVRCADERARVGNGFHQPEVVPGNGVGHGMVISRLRNCKLDRRRSARNVQDAAVASRPRRGGAGQAVVDGLAQLLVRDRCNDDT